jgi:hypothetical protein
MRRHHTASGQGGLSRVGRRTVAQRRPEGARDGGGHGGHGLWGAVDHSIRVFLAQQAAHLNVAPPLDAFSEGVDAELDG